MLTIDADDCIVDGVGFTCGDQVTAAIDIANTSATNRVKIRDCRMLCNGAAATSVGIQIGDGTNDAADTEVTGCYLDRFLHGIQWDGTRPRILNNNIIISDTALSDAVFVPDTRGSLGIRGYGVITGNTFVGEENAGSKVAVTFSAAEASSPMYVLSDNHFANCASVTADIHPEGIGINYRGNATNTAPALVTG
jgi:hypothetical protein